MEDLRTKFIANMKIEGKTHETVRKYEQLFKQMEKFALEKGIRFVGEFDLPLLEEFRSTWPDGDLARQKTQVWLRKIFKYAVARKMVHHNPTLELGKIQVALTQVVPITDKQMEAILKAAKKNPKAHALVLLMRYSGLRIRDATMLRIDKLDGNRL